MSLLGVGDAESKYHETPTVRGRFVDESNVLS